MRTMKVVVTGVKGQLGFDVMNELKKRDIEAVGTDVQEMDITNRAAVEAVLPAEKPDAAQHTQQWMELRIMRKYAEI